MKISLHLLSSLTFTQLFITLNIFVHCIESTYYCSTAGGDPCTLAETLYEPYARTGNCEYNGVYAPCDRYITPGWYKSDELVLDQCPSLNSCGAVYPIWMNGTFPQVANGVVSRTLCKTGFGGCCVRQYALQIKNCGTSYVYCLPALDSCPERLCFGTNGTCEYPTTVASTTTTTSPGTTSSAIATTTTSKTDSKEKVPLKDYKDLESRYVATIVVVVVLLLNIIGVVILMIFCHFRKKKRGREIRQSRVELVTDETGVESMTPVESNGTPPHLHFQANNT